MSELVETLVEKAKRMGWYNEDRAYTFSDEWHADHAELIEAQKRVDDRITTLEALVRELSNALSSASSLTGSMSSRAERMNWRKLRDRARDVLEG